MNVSGGCVVCFFANYKTLDTPPSPGLPFSEVFFAGYKQALESARAGDEDVVEVSEMKAVYRWCIRNPVSQDLIGEALADKSTGVGAGPRPAVYNWTFDVFFALLASSNGSGVAAMLSDHVNSFCVKSITQVRVEKHPLEGSFFCWTLGRPQPSPLPLLPPPRRPPPPKSR